MSAYLAVGCRLHVSGALIARAASRDDSAESPRTEALRERSDDLAHGHAGRLMTRTKPRESGTFARVDGSRGEPLVSAATVLESPDSPTNLALGGPGAFFEGDARNTDDARPMRPGMTKKKSGTQLRSQRTAGGPNDPRLAPGALIVVDGDEVGRKAIKAVIARVLGVDVATFADLQTLQAYIHPRSRARAGRPPVRGFLIDWELGKKRDASLLEILAWLDRVYPRTPVVTYTGVPDLAEIQRACAGSEHTVVPLGRGSASEPLRHATLAVARLPVQRTAILARSRLTDAVLKALDHQ